MKLIIVRHGETKENIEAVVYGHLPGELTDKGIEQANKTGELLIDQDIDAIFSSDLKRCVDTAQIIMKYIGNKKLITTQLLREQQQNSLNGKKVAEVDWDNLPSDVEREDQMLERAKQILTEVNATYHDKSVLFVTHKRFANVMINFLLKRHHSDKTELSQMLNLSVTIFEVDNNLNAIPLVLRHSDHIA